MRKAMYACTDSHLCTLCTHSHVIIMCTLHRSTVHVVHMIQKFPVIFWPKRILTLVAVTLFMDCEIATAGLTRLTRLSLTSASQTAIVLNQALWNVLGRLCDLHLQNLEDQGNYEVHPIILTHSTCTTCLLDESCISGIWGLTNSLSSAFPLIPWSWMSGIFQDPGVQMPYHHHKCP